MRNWGLLVFQQIFDLHTSLRQHFADRPEVHVSSNLLLYYQEGDPRSRVAPDVMVVFGVPPGLRRTYNLWEEGRVPEVVMEVTSAGTRHEDCVEKKETYATLGVREYYIIDPTADCLKPPLRAWALEDGEFIEVLSQCLVSPALGLELRLVEGRLRFADPATGRLLSTLEDRVRVLAEIHAARVQADERARQEAESRKAADERARQEAESRKAADERARQDSEARKAADERARMAEERMRAVVRELLAGGTDRETVARLVGLAAHDMP